MAKIVLGVAAVLMLATAFFMVVDAVFPFAGHSGAARSMAEPFHDLVANAGGQLAVLEAVRVHNPMARIVELVQERELSRIPTGRSIC